MPTSWRQFMEAQSAASTAREGDYPVVGSFGDLRAEYAALGAGPAVVDRSYRGLLELTGEDRAGWLHNLTTNEVKNLTPGEGNYAFATSVKGRILFDLNVLVQKDAIRVDVDRRFLEAAKSHFEKYLIIEDVRVADRSDEVVRLALAGTAAVEMLAEWGVSNAKALPSLATGSLRWGGAEVTFVRHDFCGPFAVELFLPADQAADFWRDMTGASRSPRAVPVGADAVHVRRIEAGIPWPGCEISEDVLPAETGQLERAVSYHKGCYLGQEVVERMRSRGALARQLCGLRIASDTVPPTGTEVTTADGKPAGRVTSSCQSPGTKGVIALTYVKATVARDGAEVRLSWGEGHRAEATVATLPFVRDSV